MAARYGLAYVPEMKRRVYEIYLEILPGMIRAFPGVHELLRALMEACLDSGAEGLTLTVAPGNAEALALYRSAGFVDEAFVPGFYGPGEDRYILRLRF